MRAADRGLGCPEDRGHYVAEWQAEFVPGAYKTHRLVGIEVDPDTENGPPACGRNPSELGPNRNGGVLIIEIASKSRNALQFKNDIIGVPEAK